MTSKSVGAGAQVILFHGSGSGSEIVTARSSVGSEGSTPPLGAASVTRSSGSASSDTGSVLDGWRLGGGDGGHAVHGQRLLGT